MLAGINKQEMAVAVQQASVSFLSVTNEDYLKTLDQASPFHPVNNSACNSVWQIQMMSKRLVLSHKPCSHKTTFSSQHLQM